MNDVLDRPGVIPFRREKRATSPDLVTWADVTSAMQEAQDRTIDALGTLEHEVTLAYRAEISVELAAFRREMIARKRLERILWKVAVVAICAFLGIAAFLGAFFTTVRENRARIVEFESR